MKARMHLHQNISSNVRMVGMGVIDREREREWIEQMDTILIFVCISSLHVRLS
jgi:hypothetical protein